MKIGDQIKGKMIKDDWLVPSDNGYTIIEIIISNNLVFGYQNFNENQKSSRELGYILGIILGLISFSYLFLIIWGWMKFRKSNLN